MQPQPQAASAAQGTAMPTWHTFCPALHAMYKVISIAFLITATLFAVAGMQEFRGSLQLSGADLTAYNEAVHP
ncbi:MAG: hypothetical protein JSS84_11075 [Bacteroidetes bacterium]|nr:hypothetical protein [Bacteroidota bacterium]